MQKLYEDRLSERNRTRRTRIGLVALAVVLAVSGAVGRYALAKVGERNVRLVEKTLDPLEQISLYGL